MIFGEKVVFSNFLLFHGICLNGIKHLRQGGTRVLWPLWHMMETVYTKLGAQGNNRGVATVIQWENCYCIRREPEITHRVFFFWVLFCFFWGKYWNFKREVDHTEKQTLPEIIHREENCNRSRVFAGERGFAIIGGRCFTWHECSR